MSRVFMRNTPNSIVRGVYSESAPERSAETIQAAIANCLMSNLLIPTFFCGKNRSFLVAGKTGIFLIIIEKPLR